MNSNLTPRGTESRTVAVFTGNRAEYGQLYPVIRSIAAHPVLRLRLIVSGAHLEDNFGSTISEIKNDGFEVSRVVRITTGSDSLSATAQAIGSGVVGVSQALDELQPDVFVVSADRYEGFAAMIAGTQMNIPTAHIEGGDITDGGALDDSVRHAMTKLAHLHLTTNEDSKRRVIAMGEEPWRVRNVGLAALDLIAQREFASAEEVADRFGLDLERPVIIFTQHSVTTEFEKAEQQIKPSLSALASLAKDGCQVIITYPNNDAGGYRIIEEITSFRSEGHQGIQAHRSLGRHFYHGVLNICGRAGTGVCVGNSSSGIKETPAFGCPTVNVGTRERSRLRADNVIDVQYDTGEILAASRRGLWDEAWREHCSKASNPYGAGNAGPQIADLLATVPIDARLLQKKMTY